MTESNAIYKSTLVSEAARRMRDDPQSTSEERRVMAEVLALPITSQALLHDALQYARGKRS